MIENVSTQLTVFHCFAHCLLPGRAFASLYALLFLEKEAEIGGRVEVEVRASAASLRCGPGARHLYPSLVLVQPRKTRPCLTEILLMGRKESNQTKSAPICGYTVELHG